MSRGLLPILDRTFINADGSRLEDRVPAFLLLLLVVAHGLDGRVAQDEGGRDVDEAMTAMRISAISQTAAMDMPAPTKTTRTQTMRKVLTKPWDGAPLWMKRMQLST